MRDTSKRSYKFHHVCYSCAVCVCVCHVWHKLGKSTNVGWLATFVVLHIEDFWFQERIWSYSVQQNTHIKVVNFPRQILFISSHFSYSLPQSTKHKSNTWAMYKFSHRYIFSFLYYVYVCVCVCHISESYKEGTM